MLEFIMLLHNNIFPHHHKYSSPGIINFTLITETYFNHSQLEYYSFPAARNTFGVDLLLLLMVNAGLFVFFCLRF